MTSKYGNKKVIVDGYKFDSKVEADYYYRLKIEKMKGLIKDFKVHPTFVVQESFKIKGKNIQQITYTPDFQVIKNDGTIDYIDIKGAIKTAEFRIKEKLFKKLLDDTFEDMYCLALRGETWIKI